MYSEVSKICNNIQIKPNEIRILKYNPLKEYFSYFQHSLSKYKDRNTKWRDVLHQTYNMSICLCISKKKTKGLSLNPYNEWILDIKEDINRFLEEIDTYIDMTDSEDFDTFIINKTAIVLFKYSLCNSLKADWVLEVLEINKQFNKVEAFIINPLSGTVEKIILLDY
jgi:hypothetical protein